jgi:CRP/FNR family cyclic AMP-dependent transcriptional regulator
MNIALSTLIRNELLHADGVRKLPDTRRLTNLPANDAVSESLFFLDSGFVKVIQRSEDGKEIILSIVGPGELFAEHTLLFSGPRAFTAEILQEGSIYEIPRAVFLEFARQYPETWQLMWEVALQRQLEAEQKIALLCLEDVEFRLLYYLGKLAPPFASPANDQEEYSLPLSQSELASLVGATRETTSTTLNHLSRQGLLRLGRRLVTVRSLESLRNAARNHAAKAAQGGA